ncbi:inorganic phosphate transporter, partial [Escherichia coli]|uniref:inorganic phosphate transporter n=1 Tax=Escherichia coli TaxID=562 RepID=UPI0011BAD20F
LPPDMLLNMWSTHGLAMVFSILLAAIISHLGTWFFCFPSSISHTLIVAIIGIALINALLIGPSVIDALNQLYLIKICRSLLFSPIFCLCIPGGLSFLLS